MYLRKLKPEDAPYMLSWMKDPEVTGNLRGDFASKTLSDCENFIRTSWTDNQNLYLAIASGQDEYMGTVSLKHIEKDSAEFAITVRREAMRRGYAWFGMESIIRKGFEELGLNRIYWCVSRKNERAVRFYDKHRFKELTDIPDSVLERYNGADDLKWYAADKGTAPETRGAVAGCRIIGIKTIDTDHSGALSFFEASRDVDFEIKRIYYISKVPEGERRGFHAHRKLKQMLFCPYGKILLVLENSCGREEIELSDPSVGIIIDKPTWREMLWLQQDSVLCVAASEYYDEQDYIRDYDTFRQTYL